MTTAADSLVHSYLVSVSAKLAKQFKKKRPASEVYTGPGLLQLFNFYKSNNCCLDDIKPAEAKIEEQTNGVANGKTPDESPETKPTEKKPKKGKKRKLEEMKEDPEPVTQPKQITKTEKKKKKVKKSKKNLVIVNTETTESITEKPEAVAEPEEPVEVPAVPEEVPAPEAEKSTDENTETGHTGGLVAAALDPEEDLLHKSKKLKRKANNSFRRVKEEEVYIKNQDLADNTFEAKGGADGFGFKANQILKFTKGKSFRHEKTKKKRGTYKGGEINMGVTSIKFQSDSD